MFFQNSSLRPLLFFALLGALAPIWITHREMWDGVAIEYAFETRDLSGLFYAVTASGWPIASYFYKALFILQEHFHIPYWLGIEAIYTMALLGMAYEVFHLASRRMHLSQRLSTIVLILFLAHPIWHFLMSGVHFLHMTGFWFLLMGHRLTSNKKPYFRVCGWVLVTLSFQFPASIVMIFWLELVLYVEAKKSQQQDKVRAVFLAFYAASWYIASRTIFGPTQTFGTYNQLLLPNSLESIKLFLWTGLKFASWLVVLSAPVWAALFWQRRAGPSVEVFHRGDVKLLTPFLLSPSGVALLGCVLALAPYLAVGKGPVVVMPYDWTARNALPLALPFSILIALMIEKLAASADDLKIREMKENWLLIMVFVWWLSMSILGVGGKLYQIKLEKAIETSLRQLTPPPAGLVTLQLPFDPLIRIRHNEANGLLWRAYGRAQWAVLISPPASWAQLIRESYVGAQPTAVKNVKNLELWSKFYVMGDLKTFNCEATIRFTLPPSEDQRLGWISWLSWSPFKLNASMEKTSCP
jgi:hypothetical protein